MGKIIFGKIWQLYLDTDTISFPTSKCTTKEIKDKKSLFEVITNEEDGASSWGFAIYDYDADQYIIRDGSDTFIISKADLDLDQLFQIMKAEFDSRSSYAYTVSMSDASIVYLGQTIKWP